MSETTQKSKDSKVYFPGLNGIRFFAAFSVIFHHVEQTKWWINDPATNQYPNLWLSMFCDNIGHKGRIIFFVLSGFLITYLFLAEINKTGTLNLRKFHTRRVLRVWPVYLIVVLFGFLLLPLYTNIPYHYGVSFNESIQEGYWLKFGFFFFMMANIARFLWQPVLGISQLWSIAVQEQFYLVWPFLTRLFKNYFLPFVIFFIASKVSIEVLLKIYRENYEWFPNQIITLNRLSTIIKWWEIFAVDQLAIGALCAYLFFHKKMSILNFVYNKWVVVVTTIIYTYLFFIKVDFYGHTFVEGIIAAVLMLNISTNPKFPVKLENRTYNYLGNISYGIYLFHNIAMITVLNYMLKYSLFSTNDIMFNVVFYAGTVVLTLAISAFSYKYIENYFLKLKSKYEVIKSTRNQLSKSQNA